MRFKKIFSLILLVACVSSAPIQDDYSIEQPDSDKLFDVTTDQSSFTESSRAFNDKSFETNTNQIYLKENASYKIDDEETSEATTDVAKNNTEEYINEYPDDKNDENYHIFPTVSATNNSISSTFGNNDIYVSSENETKQVEATFRNDLNYKSLIEDTNSSKIEEDSKELYNETYSDSFNSNTVESIDNEGYENRFKDINVDTYNNETEYNESNEADYESENQNREEDSNEESNENLYNSVYKTEYKETYEDKDTYENSYEDELKKSYVDYENLDTLKKNNEDEENYANDKIYENQGVYEDENKETEEVTKGFEDNGDYKDENRNTTENNEEYKSDYDTDADERYENQYYEDNNDSYVDEGIYTGKNEKTSQNVEDYEGNKLYENQDEYKNEEDYKESYENQDEYKNDENYNDDSDYEEDGVEEEYEDDKKDSRLDEDTLIATTYEDESLKGDLNLNSIKDEDTYINSYEDKNTDNNDYLNEDEAKDIYKSMEEEEEEEEEEENDSLYDGKATMNYQDLNDETDQYDNENEQILEDVSDEYLYTDKGHNENEYINENKEQYGYKDEEKYNNFFDSDMDKDYRMTDKNEIKGSYSEYSNLDSDKSFIEDVYLNDNKKAQDDDHENENSNSEELMNNVLHSILGKNPDSNEKNYDYGTSFNSENSASKQFINEFHRLNKMYPKSSFSGSKILIISVTFSLFLFLFYCGGLYACLIRTAQKTQRVLTGRRKLGDGYTLLPSTKKAWSNSDNN